MWNLRFYPNILATLFSLKYFKERSFLLWGVILTNILIRWSYVQSMNVTRSRVALVADMDKLWAIGGYDGMKNLKTVSFCL